jgi:superfamily II DNA/RNA helicase
MYIHRVGRTARYQSGGKGLTILCPSEKEGMERRWEEKGLEVKLIKIKESKMGQLQQQMQNFAFRDPEIKYMGQRVSRSKSEVVVGRERLIWFPLLGASGLCVIHEIHLLAKG